MEIISTLQPEAVQFPPGKSSLGFVAWADPEVTVDVTYELESHNNVTFSNGSRVTQKRGAVVRRAPRAIAEDVAFTFHGPTPVGVLQVKGTVQVRGGEALPQGWWVPIRSTAFTMMESELSLEGAEAGRFLAAHPAPTRDDEIVALLQRACELLERLLAKQKSSPARRKTARTVSSLKAKRRAKRKR